MKIFNTIVMLSLFVCCSFTCVQRANAECGKIVSSLSGTFLSNVWSSLISNKELVFGVLSSVPFVTKFVSCVWQTPEFSMTKVSDVQVPSSSSSGIGNPLRLIGNCLSSVGSGFLSEFSSLVSIASSLASIASSLVSVVSSFVSAVPSFASGVFTVFTAPFKIVGFCAKYFCPAAYSVVKYTISGIRSFVSWPFKSKPSVHNENVFTQFMSKFGISKYTLMGVAVVVACCVVAGKVVSQLISKLRDLFGLKNNSNDDVKRSNKNGAGAGVVVNVEVNC